MMNDFGDVTGLLHRWRSGDAQASDRLIPLVEDTPRNVAPAKELSSLFTARQFAELVLQLMGETL